MGWISMDRETFPLESPQLRSPWEAQDSDPYVPLPDEAMVKLDAELDRRRKQFPITVERRSVA